MVTLSLSKGDIEKQIYFFPNNKLSMKIKITSLIVFSSILVYFPACTGQKQTSEINEPEFIDAFVVGQKSITGQDNIPYYQIRTPNIVKTNSGKLVLICQGRNKSDWSDRSGQDLICKTSDDEVSQADITFQRISLSELLNPDRNQ